jgi:hypothetical protein
VIIEPFKGDSEKGVSILFRQTAGWMELADKIVVVDGAEPLEPGREYFVFVAEAEGVRRLVGDAEGAFMLRNGEVFGQGRGELSRRTQRLAAADFVRAINYIADSERKRERQR